MIRPFLPEDPIPTWETKPAGDRELNGIHVWKAELMALVGNEREFFSWLSEEEKGRARRLRSAVIRRRFTIAHGVVREILGGYLNQPAANIEFMTTPSGKPILNIQLSGGNPRLEFNFSHSEDLLVLAVSQDFELGIDVERLKPEIEHEAIAKNYFAPEEISWLQSLAPDNQVEAFYRIWTCKEAALKANGSGLRQRLDAVKIEFASIKKINGGWQAESQVGSNRYTLQIFQPASEYAAALAYRTEASAAAHPEIRYYHRTG